MSRTSVDLNAGVHRLSVRDQCAANEFVADSSITAPNATVDFLSANNTIFTNTISERTTGSGVTIDGLLIKDGAIPGLPPASVPDPLTVGTVTTTTELKTDVISEENPGSGVTIDGLLIKDGAIPNLSSIIQFKRCEFFVDNNWAITSIPSAGTLVQVNGTTTQTVADVPNPGDPAGVPIATTYSVTDPEFTHNNQGVLTYTGASRIFVWGHVTLSAMSEAGGKTFEFTVMRNNQGLTSSSIHRKFDTGKPDEGAVALTFMCTVTTGDTLALGIEGYTDATDITLTHFTFNFMSPPTVESVDIPAYP